jgi:predicted DsbA family dithiol-disulfide isomerase
MAHSSLQPLRIDVVSDVVCPWCFIGKRRLEKAVALKPGIPVEIRFHPYFLNDWIPREGMSREEYLTRKFGSVEGYRGMAQRVTEAAASEGLTYAIDKITRQPNTLDSHRLIHWADQQGRAAHMKQRLMDLYFTEGADLTDREVLVEAASDVALDMSRVREWLTTDKDVAEVERRANRAKESGISGVPTFIFGSRLAVSGAQAPDHLAELLEQAAAE